MRIQRQTYQTASQKYRQESNEFGYVQCLCIEPVERNGGNNGFKGFWWFCVNPNTGYLCLMWPPFYICKLSLVKQHKSQVGHQTSSDSHLEGTVLRACLEILCPGLPRTQDTV